MSSLLRSLIPFQVQVIGSTAACFSAVFAAHPNLASDFIESVDALPVNPISRLSLVNVMQELSSPTPRMLIIRRLLEDAALNIRKELMDSMSIAERDPYARILCWELLGGTDYYRSMFSINPRPEYAAKAALRSCLNDIRRDQLIEQGFRPFADVQRCPRTGDRERLPRVVEGLVKELLLCERSCLAQGRFADRGRGRAFLHSIALEDISRSHEMFCITKDKVVVEHGNFVVDCMPVHNERWNEYVIQCGAEDLRADPKLPVYEEVSVVDDITERPYQVRVDYNEPLCLSPEDHPFSFKFELVPLPAPRRSIFEWVTGT
jgi:hypothetical protein